MYAAIATTNTPNKIAIDLPSSNEYCKRNTELSLNPNKSASIKAKATNPKPKQRNIRYMSNGIQIRIKITKPNIENDKTDNVVASSNENQPKPRCPMKK